MISLSDISDALPARSVTEVIGDAASVGVVDVVADSRGVGAGALFCCVVGSNHDGHDYAAAAVDAGAVALLCQRSLALDVPQLVVEDVRAAMPVAAAMAHGRPGDQLTLVGVTGTNGKTTVVSMLDAVCKAAGRRSVPIGTLTGERTTPESPDLQRHLRQLLDAGVEVVVMEVSSHALDQHRVDELRFDAAVFTMLGVDHLDYHGDQEAYFAAKARLFEPRRCAVAVLNVDDVHGRLLRDASQVPFVAVSIDDGSVLRADAGGSTVIWRESQLSVPLAGIHNVTNALLAAEAARVLGIDEHDIVAGIGGMPPVPGRFERFVVDGRPTVVVDYAHTPDALETVLEASRTMVATDGRVVVVFGCGGDRDKGKRPLMGDVASRLADEVILTDDNPRSEDPVSIVDAIRGGARGDVTVLHDRREAIRAAIAGSSPGDLVLVAGKGHEQGQLIGATMRPFDDRAVVLELLGTVPGPGEAVG